MRVSFEDVNKNEILKYLSYRGSEIPREIDELIDKSIEAVIEKSSFLYTYREYKLERFEKNGEEKLCLGGSTFELEGNDIKNLLSECEICVVFAATLGVEIDRYVRSMQVRDFAQSIILDSCASSIIESFCNILNKELELKYKSDKLYLTDRFSPGYGDMPIESQKKLCDVMELPKKIGVNVSSSGIMIPRKSVTAIIGISKEKQSKRFSGCENCRMFRNCIYRKNGKLCKNTVE